MDFGKPAKLRITLFVTLMITIQCSNCEDVANTIKAFANHFKTSPPLHILFSLNGTNEEKVSLFKQLSVKEVYSKLTSDVSSHFGLTLILEKNINPEQWIYFKIYQEVYMILVCILIKSSS